MPVVEHHGLAESIQPEFRGIVSRPTRKWILPREAADVDDCPSPAVAESRQRLAATEEHTGQVRVESGSPFLVSKLGYWAKNSDARIIYEDVHSTEFPVYEGEKIVNLFRVPYVHGSAGDAGRAPKLGNSGRYLFLVSSADSDACSFVEQGLGDGTTDAAGRAGYDSDFVLKKSSHARW
jgi:hypothetical protein